MDIWWTYIRAMFEEKYAEEENPFECTGTDTYGTCICIPCAAVNYIANEIKLCQNAQNKEENVSMRFKVQFKWEDKYGIYFAQREDSDWNKDIYDVKAQGSTQVGDAEICKINLTDFSYIKIRDREKILDPSIDRSAMLFQLLTHLGGKKTELDIYVVVARNARNQYPMEMYIDRLFRLLVFLHPKEGLEALDGNMQDGANEVSKEYNKKLLDDYEEMIRGWAKLQIAGDETNINKILELISRFVGLDIRTAYLYLKKSDNRGDITDVNELFVARMHDTVKLGELGEMSRISRLKQMCLQAS